MRTEDLITEEQLKRTISVLVGNTSWEINDQQTRLILGSQVDEYLSYLLQQRRIYQFVFICDETNNTPDIIDDNNIVLDVHVKYSNIMKDLRYYRFDFKERIIKQTEEVDG